jgi:hypothetical protein
MEGCSFSAWRLEGNLFIGQLTILVYQITTFFKRKQTILVGEAGGQLFRMNSTVSISKEAAGILFPLPPV